MKLSPRFRVAVLFGFLFGSVFALPACRTTPEQGTSAQAPFVISFKFENTVPASDAQKARFITALQKYTVPETTRIKVGGKQIWPPKNATLDTDRVVAGTKPDRRAGTVHRGPVGGTQFQTSSLTRPRTTQQVTFRTEADMKAFLRAIAAR